MVFVCCISMFWVAYIVSFWVWLEALYDKFKSRKILLGLTVSVASLITATIVTAWLYIFIRILSS